MWRAESEVEDAPSKSARQQPSSTRLLARRTRTRLARKFSPNYGRPSIILAFGGSRQAESEPVGRREQILSTITRIHAAGLDADKWPEALAAFANLIGGHGASLEFLDRPTLRHRRMFSYGLPAVGDYVAHYAPMCPRIPSAFAVGGRRPVRRAAHRRRSEMDGNPFYAEFLAAYDMRYYLGAVLAKSDDELVISACRSGRARVMRRRRKSG